MRLQRFCLCDNVISGPFSRALLNFPTKFLSEGHILPNDFFTPSLFSTPTQINKSHCFRPYIYCTACFLKPPRTNQATDPSLCKWKYGRKARQYSYAREITVRQISPKWQIYKSLNARVCGDQLCPLGAGLGAILFEVCTCEKHISLPSTSPAPIGNKSWQTRHMKCNAALPVSHRHINTHETRTQTYAVLHIALWNMSPLLCHEKDSVLICSDLSCFNNLKCSQSNGFPTHHEKPTVCKAGKLENQRERASERA